MTQAFPTDPDQITPDWLNKVLNLSADMQVSDVALTRIGQEQGFSGCRLYRIALSGPARVPATLVAKLSPQDRAVARRLAPANLREVAFYAAAPDRAGLPVPACHLAVAAPATGETLLLLQDLGGLRSVPFAQGLDVPDAAMAADALARFHAPAWDRDDPHLQGKADTPDELATARLWPDYRIRLADLLPGLTLPASLLALGDRLAAGQGITGPLTRVHRDVQADNLRFGPGGAVILDWQMTGRGCGAHDLGYLMISSVPPLLRRRHEAGLVARYHAGLTTGGVRGYSPDDARRDYLASVGAKFRMTIAATMLMDNRGEAKRTWRRIDLERLIAFADDHPPV